MGIWPERTHSAYALGFVGLIALMPLLALALPAGHIVDTHDRRRILIMSLAIFTVSSNCEPGDRVANAWAHRRALYGCVLLHRRCAGSFHTPARNALLPWLVPADILANAVTWNSGGWQLASVVGPAAGGALIAARGGAVGVYVCAAICTLMFLILATAIRQRSTERLGGEMTVSALVAGIRFVARSRLLLPIITLDLFAVLLGGATTLLPIYAKDILHVGPAGLGWLDAAPSLGAVLIAVALASFPPMRRAGRTLLWAVFGFGAGTLIFGVSHSFALSMAMLVVIGGLDMVSVVIRNTIAPLVTPDAMRGRVGSITGLFIGTSNLLGGFESGAVAGAFGPVFSVVSGAIGTLIVVVAVAWYWPSIRGLGTLASVEPEPIVT